MKSLANHLREAVYKIMSAFHTLTGCYYIVPFFGQCKYSIFKNIQKHSNAKSLLLSLNIEGFKVPDFIDFIIYILYKRSRSEKVAAQSKYVTAIKTRKIGKKTFNDIRWIPPDQSTRKIKIISANFVTLDICMLIFR